MVYMMVIMYTMCIPLFDIDTEFHGGAMCTSTVLTVLAHPCDDVHVLGQDSFPMGGKLISVFQRREDQRTETGKY